MFDEVIRVVRKWFDKHEGRQLTIGDISIADSEENPLLEEAVRSASTIILKEDTQFELGHPSAGSTNAILTTKASGLVTGNQITIVGPDLPEVKMDKLPFAQVIVTQCQDEIEQIPFRLDNLLYKYIQYDGYMIRSVPGQIWARVSKDAFKSGFTLLDLGKRLLTITKQKCPAVSKADIYFVTSRKADIDELEKLLAEAKAKLQKIQTFGQKPDGDYECDTALDCEECPEQEVCDTIRDVIKIRQGDRIISLGEKSE